VNLEGKKLPPTVKLYLFEKIEDEQTKASAENFVRASSYRE
jgi:hypothetical protein